MIYRDKKINVRVLFNDYQNPLIFGLLFLNFIVDKKQS